MPANPKTTPRKGENPASENGTPATTAAPAETARSARAAGPKRSKPPTKKSARAASGQGARVPQASANEPSDEAIRLRAYFIAERRIQLSLPGDAAHDWIEARRQLLEEGPL